ncbi:hypothetical protein ACJX0J_019061, partial [Zea mays]
IVIIEVCAPSHANLFYLLLLLVVVSMFIAKLWLRFIQYFILLIYGRWEAVNLLAYLHKRTSTRIKSTHQREHLGANTLRKMAILLFLKKASTTFLPLLLYSRSSIKYKETIYKYISKIGTFKFAPWCLLRVKMIFGLWTRFHDDKTSFTYLIINALTHGPIHVCYSVDRSTIMREVNELNLQIIFFHINKATI